VGGDIKEGGDDFFHMVLAFFAKTENMARNSAGDQT
jgi:hypothetical protein